MEFFCGERDGSKCAKNRSGRHAVLGFNCCAWLDFSTIKRPLQLSLRKGADINAECDNRVFALQAALLSGNEEIVGLQLKNGANGNAQTRCYQSIYYESALQAASNMVYKEIMRLLLDHGANVNDEGGPYGNALQVASAKGYEEIVRLLLNDGANVNAKV